MQHIGNNYHLHIICYSWMVPCAVEVTSVLGSDVDSGTDVGAMEVDGTAGNIIKYKYITFFFHVHIRSLFKTS